MVSAADPNKRGCETKIKRMGWAHYLANDLLIEGEEHEEEGKEVLSSAALYGSLLAGRLVGHASLEMAMAFKARSDIHVTVRLKPS